MAEIGICDGTKMMVDSVLESVGVRKSQVEKLAIDLSRIPATIDATLLSQAVTKVRECRIRSGQPGQLETILGAVSEAQDLALKTLRLGLGVVQVSPDNLGMAAVKLNSLVLGVATSGLRSGWRNPRQDRFN